ncbi:MULTISPECIES: malonate decarboxylase holo-ACP synthase [unclassified Duganella]|uniref:malonate decarboxylase holo-ACP synthase n=1 Tax=unclassified Duganella TaxID=2636909 RepID=UPI001E5506EB|nr:MULTISPECIES: malonate decarboxylase holo-ACP synthase [unclassified Duganella]
MGMNTRENGYGYTAHDLLWAADPRDLTVMAPLPHWIDADWLTCAPVVVRRESAPGTAPIPVGIRGQARNERHQTYLARKSVIRSVKPEMLARAMACGLMAFHREFAALRTLQVLAPQLDAMGLVWGPTGGVGFELASGLPVLRPDSDLDLVVRAAAPLSVEIADALRAMNRSAGCRLDIQIDTGHGAFALMEWRADCRQILLKTDSGPLLTSDPWRLHMRRTSDEARQP